jgi:hypothetical protein
MADRVIKPDSGNQLVLQDEGGSAAITIATDGGTTFAENIKITATKGINFSAYATSGNPSSNLLDDYEEGTWTPTVSSGTVSTLGDSSNYRKIGNIVHVWSRLKTFSDTTSSNGFVVSNLPFTVAGSSESVAAQNTGEGWGTAVGDERSVHFYGGGGNTSTEAYYGSASYASDYNVVSHSDLASNTEIMIKLTYIST